MANLKKLVRLFLDEPQKVEFADVELLLNAFGYQLKKGSGSHRVFHKPGNTFITVPTIGGAKVKTVYVKKIVNLLSLEEWYELNAK